MEAKYEAANHYKKIKGDNNINVSKEIKNWLNFSIEILGVKPEDI